MHLYKYVQSHIIIFHQLVSITPVTIIMASYKQNSMSVQIIVQKCVIKPLDVA